MLTPGNRRRLHRLYEAALNLGMKPEHARHYAQEALADELRCGDWHIVSKTPTDNHP